jgi:hypothetical protein
LFSLQHFKITVINEPLFLEQVALFPEEFAKLGAPRKHLMVTQARQKTHSG